MQSNQKYLFNINDYNIIKEIKRGGFAIIYLVQNKTNKAQYVAKVNLIKNSKQNKLFISREVRILMQVQHPTIIQFQGFSYTDFGNKKNITILMSYMKNGSLADLINKEKKGLCPDGYDDTKRQIILIGIARGMMILHKLRIIHRDLKPDNILLDDNFHPYITDFGLSKFFDPGHSMNQSIKNAGTAAYMAPEVIESDHFNTKADVYSFGILMYELLTGKQAYFDLLNGEKKISVYQLKRQICKGLRPKIEDGVMKKSLRFMIEKCWSNDPKERPTFSELYRKLSLSNDDMILEFESNMEQNAIDYEEEEESNDDDDGLEINKKFCLKSVDYDEILDYVDEINVENKAPDQRERETSAVDNEEIEKLKKEVKELKKASKNHESKIKKIESENLQKEVDKLRQKTKSQESIIKSLESQLTDAKNQITQLSNRVGQLEKKVEQQNGFIEKVKMKEKKKMPVSCRFHDLSETNGVISILEKEITLSAGGANSPSFPISNITSDLDDYFINFDNFNPRSESDSFIQIDFGSMRKIDLYSYVIRTNCNQPSSNCHPKTWRIEGSNDKENWTILDRRANDSSLNGRMKKCNFVCQYARHESKSDRYRYVRYVQEDSWLSGAPHRIYITYFELFGDVFNNKE